MAEVSGSSSVKMAARSGCGVLPFTAGDPLATADIVTPNDLDGRPMAVLFGEHLSAVQTETAFRSAGCHFNKRIELRTFLPGLQFVAAGACVMVCDMITAYSHLKQASADEKLSIRRFSPHISTSVSILTPGYATQSIVGKAFIRELHSAVKKMQDEIHDALK